MARVRARRRVARARRRAHAPRALSRTRPRRYHRLHGSPSTGLRGRHSGRRPSEPDPGHAGAGKEHVPHPPPIVRRRRRRRRHRRPRRRVARAAARAARRSCSSATRSRGGATHVAAGMLAPISEARIGERDAARAQPRVARPLSRVRRGAGATPPGATPATARCGTLAVARDRDEAEALERELAEREALGLPVERLLRERGAPPRAGARADAAARARRPRRPRRRPARAERRARRRVRARGRRAARARDGRARRARRRAASASPASSWPTASASPPTRS